MDGTMFASGANGHRSVDGRAGDFSLAAAPYKLVGGTLVSATVNVPTDMGEFGFNTLIYRKIRIHLELNY